MLQVVINLLTLRALSTPIEVYAGLVCVWLMLLVAGFTSVLSRPWSLTAKMLWCLLLTVLPVVGMTVYCLFSLTLADYSFLKMLGLSRKQTSYLTAKRPDRPLKRQS